MNRPGFTLLELLVAMAVAGIAVSIGARTIAVLSDAEARGASAEAPVAALASTIRDWVEAAEIEPADPLIGIDSTTHGWSADELILSTASGYPLDPAPARLHLRIARDSGLVVSVEQSTGLRHVVLIPHAQGMALEFGSYRAGAVVWQRSWYSGESAPDVIRMRLEYSDPAPDLARRLPIIALLRSRG